MAVAWTRHRKQFRAGFLSKQQVLEIRLGPLLQSPPFVDGHHHGYLYTAPGNNLGTFSQARLKQLAESRLGFRCRP